VEQRCNSKGDPQDNRKESKDEEDRDKEGFKDDSRESQEKVEKKTLLLASC